MLKFWMIVSLCLCGIWGCSAAQDEWSKDRPPVVKTTGQVFYQGEPVDAAKVFFATEDNSRSGYAVTDNNGHFQLTTFETGDGAVIGRYLVTISKVVIESDQPPNVPDDVVANITTHVFLPEKYGDTKTSGLTAEVTSEGPNEFVFELTDM